MRGAWLDSFEFKEFEEDFENYPDTLRPFGWRRIQVLRGFRRTHQEDRYQIFGSLSLNGLRGK